MRTRRRRRLKPIPWVVTVAMAFIPDDLTEDQFVEEVRKIVRSKLPTIREELEEESLFEEYDERISEIIEEELARN